MKLLIIALTILLAGCTGNKAGFETGQDTFYKPVVITIIDINEVPPVVKPPVITPPSSCIKYKNKCKNKRFKGGHKKGKGKGHSKGKH